MTQPSVHVSVAIIGGGATGAMIAWHLLRARPDLGVDAVAVVEPRPHLGAGQAYGTSDPSHRINVPASRMSIDTQAPDDFSHWLDRESLQATDPEAFTASGDIYPSRATFGAYLAARLAPGLSSGQIRHIRAIATAVRKQDDGWVIKTDAGVRVTAHTVVIATSHPPPSLPAPLRPVADDPRVIANPWAPQVLDAIAPDARLVIVGTGLTMADVVASVTARGHRGPITAFSRRGLRSRGHSATMPAPLGDFTTAPSSTVRALLSHIRAVLNDNSDRPWQDVLDAARKQGLQIWSALSVGERKRLVRHLRPFWDVHRFRVAPQIETVIEQRIGTGTLHIFAGRLIAAEATSDEIRLTVQPRNAPAQVLKADYVINTTGPDHAGILANTPYLHILEKHGFIESDPMGLGLHTAPAHRAISKGRSQENLFVAGPLSRGTFGELMGLPEVTANAESVASILAQDTVTPRHPFLIEA